MDFSAVMSSVDQKKVEMQVDSINKALHGTREVSQSLGKDDFLKILITQLTHQDPTQPMKDRDFIAQMAQFSSLEQMTNMNQEFNRLAGMLQSGQAMTLLGKTVEVREGERIIEGTVEAVSGRDIPQVLINGEYYDFNSVEKVKSEGGSL
jgi:flagellar basal-body rod modification protein FlgD